MIRPRLLWIWFSAALIVVVASLAGVSALVARLEKREQQAQLEADREQRFRLALWRLDAAVAIVMATENARPPTDYTAPSVLEGGSPEPAKWHFQLGPGSEITSPRRAPDELTALEQLLSDPATPPASPTPVSETNRERHLPSTRSPISNRAQLEEAAATEEPQSRSRSRYTSMPPPKRPAITPATQTQLNQNELNARAANYENALKQRQQLMTVTPSHLGLNQFRRAADQDPGKIGLLAPVWLGNELFLVRRIQKFTGDERLQVVWLDWVRWSKELAASVEDLLTGARLIPIPLETSGGEERRLVGLPLRLEADEGTAIRNSPGSKVWSPVRLTLLLAWIAVLAAAGLAAWLLHGTLALSERRAAFVSAVTHELRTPLTTFKLYSEMLADDMVPDPLQRRRYLETLRAEATRLGHLVDNVLAYARLERGRTERPREHLSVDELIARVRERLDRRTAEVGVVLDYLPGNAGAARIRVDVGVVEQILFNLVDNACKYAGPSAMAEGQSAGIQFESAILPHGRVALRIRDHGPGLEASVKRHLFEPFSKSAEQAALSAPGVGLGLSLCRQLIRSIGGDLVLEASGPDGATFRLELPT